MKFYDTHAHVNSPEYGDEYEKVIARAESEGVWFNNIGTNKADSSENVLIAREHGEGVYATVGLHPGFVSGSDADGRREEFDYDFFAGLAREEKVVGIGECGLDYYRIPAGMNLEDVRQKQVEVFKKHIELANASGKVLIVHCRASKDTEDAYTEALKILKNGAAKKILVHSFTASPCVCEEFLALGAHIAFNGIITFDKTGNSAKAVALCPEDKFVLETDAPYLAPVPHRGKRNEPVFVKHVAEKIAEIRGATLAEIADQTFENAKKLFLANS